jgi:hypothetical protein
MVTCKYVGPKTVIWCEGMTLALQGVPSNFEGKGLSVSFGWLNDSGEPPRIVGVVYHRKAQDEGIILNHCPWCGVRIRFDEKGVS